MWQTSTKGEQNKAWLGGKGDPLWLYKLKFDSTTKWYMH